MRAEREESGAAAGDAGEVREGRIRVPRTARYSLLGGPRPGVREVWIVCHGYRQLARRFIRRFEPLDDGTRLVVAPEALSRFYLESGAGRHGAENRVGASWMTREDREAEIADYVRYLDRVADHFLPGSAGEPGGGESGGPHGGLPSEADSSRLGDEIPGDGIPALIVLGFSQGAHTAARWAMLGRTRPTALVLWGAEMPQDLDLGQRAERFRELDLFLVRGEADELRARNLEGPEEKRLRSAGISYRLVHHPGGHRVDGELLRDLSEGGAFRTLPRR